MKRNCLFYLLIFVCLFGFINSVEAAGTCKNDNFKSYTFKNHPDCLDKNNGRDCDLDGGAKDTILTAITTAGGVHSGSGYSIEPTKFKKIEGNNGITGNIVAEYYISNLDCGDFKSNDALIVSTLQGISPSGITGNLYQYLRDSKKCTNYASSKVCNTVKNWKEDDGGAHSDDDGEVVYCQMVPVAPDDSPFDEKTLSLYFVYNTKDSSKTGFYTDARGTTKARSSIKQNGHTFYLYPAGSNQSDFVKSISDYYKSEYDKNKKYPSCDKNFLKLCGKASDDTKWYLVRSSVSCDSAEYNGLTQELGDDATPGITLSGQENRDRAKELIQDEVIIKTCSDLFKGDGGSTILLDILKILVGTVKVLVPVVLLVMGSVDFAKAIIAQDDNAIKKAQSKFIKRLLIAVIIFLIPTILTALLDIAHSVWPDIISSSDDVFCGIL